jgi:hypothetical protein
MRDNKKYKNSSQFLFWLGLSPVFVVLTGILIVMIGVLINYKRSEFTETKPKPVIIHDTIFIECKERNFEEVPVVKTTTNQKVKVENTVVGEVDSGETITDTVTNKQ